MDFINLESFSIRSGKRIAKGFVVELSLGWIIINLGTFSSRSGTKWAGGLSLVTQPLVSELRLNSLGARGISSAKCD